MIRSQLRQLGRALRKRPANYVIWLLANLGGLLVAYLATVTIWAFHKRLGSLVPEQSGSSRSRALYFV